MRGSRNGWCVCVCQSKPWERVHLCEYEVLLTMLENTDEQGLVSLAVPPVDWDLGVERLRDPDVQLTGKDMSQNRPFLIARLVQKRPKRRRPTKGRGSRRAGRREET